MEERDALSLSNLYLRVDVAGEEEGQSEEEGAREDTNNNNPRGASEAHRRLVLVGDRVDVEILKGIWDWAGCGRRSEEVADLGDVDVWRPLRDSLRGVRVGCDVVARDRKPALLVEITRDLVTEVDRIGFRQSNIDLSEQAHGASRLDGRVEVEEQARSRFRDEGTKDDRRRVGGRCRKVGLLSSLQMEILDPPASFSGRALEVGRGGRLLTLRARFGQIAALIVPLLRAVALLLIEELRKDCTVRDSQKSRGGHAVSIGGHQDGGEGKLRTRAYQAMMRVG